jgi:sugar phosphate isomerase/epimerase
MKYSFMSFSCPQQTLPELLGTAKIYGYDGIEPRVECKHRHGVELDADQAARRRLKGEIDKSGLRVSCIATSCTFASFGKTSSSPS